MDNAILVRVNAESAMPVTDCVNWTTWHQERGEILDVARVGHDGVGQRSRLVDGDRNIVSRVEVLDKIYLAAKEEPWKTAFLVRGSPVFPLSVKNYGLGITDVPLLPIATFSCIFTTVYAFQNIYLGSTCKNLKEVFAPKKAVVGPRDWASTAKSLMPIVFNIMLVIFLVKALKAQFKKQKAEIEAKLKQKTEKKSS